MATSWKTRPSSSLKKGTAVSMETVDPATRYDRQSKKKVRTRAAAAAADAASGSVVEKWKLLYPGAPAKPVHVALIRWITAMPYSILWNSLTIHGMWGLITIPTKRNLCT